MKSLQMVVLAAALSVAAMVRARADEVPATKVAILMFDGVQIIDFAAPYEVFGQAGFDVFTVSADGKPVTAWMDLHVNVDHSFASAPDADIVLVPGGHVHDAMKDEATLAWLRGQAEPADHVLSVCTGSFILASTGLLDGKSATTFHRAFDSMAAEFPAVHIVRDQRWVDNGKLVTSAGLASGIDAALHVVAEIRGVTAARSVAMHLEYDWSPERGFVRGLMADQHVRLPATLDFPDDTKIERVLSLGDTKYWEMEFLVQSPLSPAQLMEYIRKRAMQDKALSVMNLPDPTQLAWQYESEYGGQWRLSFAVTDVESDNEYRLVGKLMALN